jgi:hypothetical protein
MTEREGREREFISYTTLGWIGNRCVVIHRPREKEAMRCLGEFVWSYFDRQEKRKRCGTVALNVLFLSTI